MKRYLSNTAAIRDSLIRFEYTKLRLTSTTADFFNLSSKYLSLQQDNTATSTALGACTIDLNQKTADLGIAKKKLKSANGEKWGWRILAGVAVFAVIKSKFPP